MAAAALTNYSYKFPQKQMIQQNLIHKQIKNNSLIYFLQDLKKNIQASQHVEDRTQKISVLIQQYDHLDQKIKEKIQNYINFLKVSLNKKNFNQRTFLNQEQKSLFHYWGECQSLLLKKQDQFNIRNLLSQGQYLILIYSSDINKTSFAFMCLKSLLFNSSVLYFKLQMYREATRNLQAALKFTNKQDVKFIANACNLSLLINIKIEVNPQKLNFQILQNQQYKNWIDSDPSFNQLKQLIMLLKIKKDQLASFIKQQSQNKCKIHIHNYYNLALICKKHQLNFIAISILKNLISQCKTKQLDYIKIKAYVLLSQVYEDCQSLQASLSCLQRIKTDDHEIKKQIDKRISSLRKQIKLKHLCQKSSKTFNRNKRQCLLDNIQSELGRLVKIKQPVIYQTKKKIKSIFPKFKTLKILHPPVDLTKKDLSSGRSSVKTQKLTQIKFNQIKTIAKQPNTVQLTDYIEDLSPNSPQTASSTQSIHFFSKNMDEKLLMSLISKFQEKIQNLMAQQRLQEATVQIQNIIQQLQELDGQLQQKVFTFRLKCVNWCYKLGKRRYLGLLLKKFIKIYRQKTNKSYLISLLHQLSRYYQQSAQYKNAINANTQIFELGQTQVLDKIGQLYILCQDYSQSLICYQQYDKIKNSIYTKVKLAHAYSKILGGIKKTIQILQQILFSNKKILEYRKFNYQEMPNIHNAVLLLSNIYLKMQNIQKAIDICQKYIQQNFQAYPILYLLGIMHFRKGNTNKAFDYLVESLRVKPDHLPSLLQLVNYIGKNEFYNNQILKILKKAIMLNHRDWQLLKLLISVLTKSKVSQKQLNIQNLISFAQILQQHQGSQLDFMMQIEAVWLWILDLAQERKKKISRIDSFDKRILTIYHKLGQIYLQTGNYPLSETYFNKILFTIKMEKTMIIKNNKQYQESIRIQLDLCRKLAFIKSQQHKFQQSISFLEQSCTTALSNGMKIQADQDSYKIGLIYKEFGQYSLAFQKFMSILTTINDQNINSKDQSDIQYHLDFWIQVQTKIAQCQICLDQWAEAKKTYQVILNRKIQENAIKELIKIYFRQGNYQCAQQLQQSLQEYLKNKSCK